MGDACTAETTDDQELTNITIDKLKRTLEDGLASGEFESILKDRHFQAPPSGTATDSCTVEMTNDQTDEKVTLEKPYNYAPCHRKYLENLSDASQEAQLQRRERDADKVPDQTKLA